MSNSNFGGHGGQSRFAGLIDHNETYGRHIIEGLLRGIPSADTAIDLGAGPGLDLASVRRVFPSCKTIAIEGSRTFLNSELPDNADEIVFGNLERDIFPVAPGSVDIVIANQILEHTKEVFWIFDQVFRVLKVGGHLIVGVPNVASFHNRILLLAGIHPTQYKMASAHVRPFSKGDTAKFLSIFPGCSVIAFQGAQFYPFPRPIARILAGMLPSMAFSIFFLIRKNAEYEGQFAAHPSKAGLETNFWCGNDPDSRY